MWFRINLIGECIRSGVHLRPGVGNDEDGNGRALSEGRKNVGIVG